jgi:cytochrome c554/c'-like protein
MAHHSEMPTQLADVPPSGHRRQDRLARLQIWLPLAAAAAAGLWWAWHALWGADMRYMPGPLAQVHAPWENRCAACHATSEPLSAANWTTLIAHDPHAADAQCQTCHGGPPHHARETAGESPGCTACHREHRGRHADVKRVNQVQCLSCHLDLGRHLATGAGTDFLDVSGFDPRSHPEFALFRGEAKDPGRIAFNHKLHLMPGLREQADTSAPFTYADLPPAFRDQYQSTGTNDMLPVQLQCNACHQVDAAGAYVLPVNYERHCQACHPLTFAAPGPNNTAAVPHRLQPSEAIAWLRGYFTERLTKDDLGLLEQSVRPLPGKNPEREAATRKLGAALQNKIEAAQRILLGPSTCGKCHTSLRSDLGARQRVEPAGIPTVWFVHARFDHASHRGVACGLCHAGAENSRTQADVLLPRIEMCNRCHSPAAGSGGATAAGARQDCVECHRYHDGDLPHAGRGAESRRPPRGGTADVQQFLQGVTNRRE